MMSESRERLSVKNLSANQVMSFLAVLLLVACASDKQHMRLYAGPERPSEEIAQLLVPESLEVRSINGEDIPRIPRVIRTGERRLDLRAGSYEMVVYYDAVWPLGSSGDEAVRSEPQRVSVELKAGHTYRFGHQPAIDLEDARRLARDLRLTIVDLDGGQPVQLTVEPSPEEVTAQVAVIPIAPLEDAAAAAPAVEGSEALPALELLKFWWRQASSEERAKFRGWIEE